MKTKNGNGNGPRAKVEQCLRAGIRVIWIQSVEEKRVESAIALVAKRLNREMITWSCTEGFSDNPSLIDPSAIFTRSATDIGKNVLIIARDVDPFFTDPILIRQLRDTVKNLKNGSLCLILLSAEKPQDKILTDIPFISWPRPDRTEMMGVLEAAINGIMVANEKLPVEKRMSIPTDGEKEKILDASMGMTSEQAGNAYAVSLISKREINPVDVASAKKEEISKSGILQYYEPDAKMADVGGLAELKKWLAERRNGFSQDAKKYGLKPPRGVILTGPPGTGKSLSSKAVSSLWEFPLIRMDFGSVFDKFQGESERKLRDCLDVAESCSPCVLWIDEIEKAMAGTEGSGVSDGGTTIRLFGSFLTWMQESEKPVFVIATSNDVQALKPEFVRRFDDVFFVDLPEPIDRKEILAIHLRKRGHLDAKVNLDVIARKTDLFSGAELEKVIESGLYRSFSAGREKPTTKDFLSAASEIIPVAKSQEAKVTRIRDWAKGNARMANRVESQKAKTDRTLEFQDVSDSELN